MSRPRHLSAVLALVVAAIALTAGPAQARSKDHDRMPDKWEKRYHLNVKKDDSRRDRDRDGLSNYGEYRAHTNPRKKDTDHDGRRDGREDYDRDHLRNAAEIRTGFDPGDADSDNDGTKDGRENAGTIVKLSDTSVKIKLAVGGSLTATLGDGLTVDCTDPASGADADTPEPGEDDAAPGEDDPLPDDPSDTGETAASSTAGGDEDGGDDSGSLRAHASGEDDPDVADTGDATDDADFDQSFADDAGAGASCSTTTLKVGAIVHKAKVARTASGKVLVSVKLVKKKK